MVWVGVLNMFLAFFVYLLMAGAGLRALEVVVRAALMGLAIGILMSALPYYFSAKLDHGEIGYAVFMHFAILGCVVGLAMESVRRAREYLVAKSSTFEVVCLNVLAVAFGGPPDTFAFFDMFTEAAYVVLVNPLGFWLPEDLAWLKMLLSLWPSAIAIWAASHGDQAGRFVRLFLMWWVQLMYATWVFPASFEILAHLGDASGYFYLDLFLAAIGMVRVLLTMLSLRISLWGSTEDDTFDLPEGETAKTAYRRSLIDGMVVLPLPGWVYAAGGFCAYVLVNVAQHFLTPEMAVASGFFSILGVSAAIEALCRRLSPVSTMGFGNALAANVLLVAGLLVLREQPLLPRHVRVIDPRLAERAEPSPVQPIPLGPSVRSVSSSLNRLRSGSLVACEIANGGELQLKCAGESWRLASLAHPPRIKVPVAVGPVLAMYTLRYLDIDARCLELAVLVPEAEPQNVLLLVFLSSASLPGQVGWVVGSEARCRHLRVVILPNTPQGEPTILFDSGEMENGLYPRQADRVVTLQRHPIEESEIDAVADSAPAPAGEKLEAGSGPGAE